MSKKNQLVNKNQEQFAQLIASGLNASDAYSQIYGNRDTGNSSKLRNKPHVADRIREIMVGGAIAAKVNGARVIEELACLGMANMADIIDIQEDGSAVVDLRSLTREQAAAISEIESVVLIDPETGVKRVRTKVKLFDKKGPLDTLAKHFGLLIDKHEHGAPGDFSKVESIADIADKIRKELGDEDAAKFMRLIEEAKTKEPPAIELVALPAPMNGGAHN